MIETPGSAIARTIGGAIAEQGAAGRAAQRDDLDNWSSKAWAPRDAFDGLLDVIDRTR
jgi:hypothetical protein